MRRFMDFLSEGMVGAAVLALGLIVLPLLPFIAIGWCFSRAASAMSASGQDPKGLEAKPASAAPKEDAQ